MEEEQKMVKCPWCEKEFPQSEIAVKSIKYDHGTVIERRCPKCGKVLAAYSDKEKDFLPQIRKF